MREKFTRKLQRTSTHSYIVNIPKIIINRFKWRDKQKVEIVFSGRKGQFVIQEVKKIKKRKK